MSIKKFSGVIPPVSSAFDNSGNVDYTATKAVADYLINAGVSGLFYLGSGPERAEPNQGHNSVGQHAWCSMSAFIRRAQRAGCTYVFHVARPQASRPTPRPPRASS